MHLLRDIHTTEINHDRVGVVDDPDPEVIAAHAIEGIDQDSIPEPDVDEARAGDIHLLADGFKVGSLDKLPGKVAWWHADLLSK